MVYKNNKRSKAITKVDISAFYQNFLYSKLNNHYIFVVHIPSVMSCAMGLLTSLPNNLINRRYYQLTLFAYNFSFSQRRAMNTTLNQAQEWRTLKPSSQDTQRQPLVKKHAAASRPRWLTQPSLRSCVWTASIQGKPVLPWIK